VQPAAPLPPLLPSTASVEAYILVVIDLTYLRSVMFDGDLLSLKAAEFVAIKPASD
jgi:hypothetical protein